MPNNTDTSESSRVQFEKKLGELVNRYSQENGSNTPDFILADYLIGCLRALERAVDHRDRWYGVKHSPNTESPTPSH